MIRNFRPYQKGDALHSIDWKQTGKRNELIVKEYEHESESDTHFYSMESLMNSSKRSFRSIIHLLN
ncbi:DUF58 domain-containing protein [Enterococcus termitis]